MVKIYYSLEYKTYKSIGLSAKLSQTVINSALMLVIYEKIQVIVEKVLLALLTKRG